MRPLVIIGAGGFGREVAWLVEDINRERATWELLGFLDDTKELHGRVVNGYPVLGDLSWAERERARGVAAVCAIGDPKAKRRLVGKARRAGLQFASLIHPSVTMSGRVEVGEGVIVCAGCILTVDIRLGEHVALNPGCGVGHDVFINRYATLFWHVDLAGHVSIGEGCLLGTKATVIQGVTVGVWSTIGAGAVVIRDIPPHCTAVGVPARPIKFHAG
ncbi:MAG: acetyltransferase [Clostridia bacterium]|nr:MAG: acetyltransferase [Clostridia bacterium]